MLLDSLQGKSAQTTANRNTYIFWNFYTVRKTSRPFDALDCLVNLLKFQDKLDRNRT